MVVLSRISLYCDEPTHISQILPSWTSKTLTPTQVWRFEGIQPVMAVVMERLAGLMWSDHANKLWRQPPVISFQGILPLKDFGDTFHPDFQAYRSLSALSWQVKYELWFCECQRAASNISCLPFFIWNAPKLSDIFIGFLSCFYPLVMFTRYHRMGSDPISAHIFVARF